MAHERRVNARRAPSLRRSFPHRVDAIGRLGRLLPPLDGSVDPRSSKQHAVHCRSSSRLLDFIRQSALRRLINITFLHAHLPARAMRCIADAAHNIRM